MVFAGGLDLGFELAFRRAGVVHHHCGNSCGGPVFQTGRPVVPQGSSASLLANILWILFGGLGLAIENALAGVFFCITIIGIPFGKQCFKLAKLSLTPFGAQVRPVVRNPQV